MSEFNGGRRPYPSSSDSPHRGDFPENPGYAYDDPYNGQQEGHPSPLPATTVNGAGAYSPEQPHQRLHTPLAAANRPLSPPGPGYGGIGSVETPGFPSPNPLQHHANPYQQPHITAYSGYQPPPANLNEYYDAHRADDSYAAYGDEHLYPGIGGAQQQPGYPMDESNDYLLKPYGQQPSHQPIRPPFGHQDSYGEDGDESTFQPFPIAGAQYALNTYEDDEESLEYGSSESSLTPGMHPIQPPPPHAARTATEDDDDYSYQDENPYDQDEPLVPPPPEGMQPRRTKTMKRVRLYRGNLVLDCPVSKKLLGQFHTSRNEREFTHMRYSAATCDPADFVQNQFTLRQTCYQQPRQTELFICVTIYNEDDILLGRTLQGIFRNIRHLASRHRSKTWGADSWKKVVVCVVADGRFKVHPRARALMAALGVYQEGFAKNIVNDRPVTAHIYEYTTMVGISHVDKTVKLTTEKTIPVQMVFCLKEKNQKKINSHRWFFQAFGPILNPKVCILLDAGTMPSDHSIYHLWKTFDMHPNVGGACGEIKAYLGTGWSKLLNPLVAAQNFEYKMSNILDKPLESVFGFITVLPGAFSAYRYVALQNDVNGQGPLEKYFKGETLHEAGAGIFTANMYLAEDRILCFELVAKRGCNWLLKYVKSAHAATDVPDKLAELVLQRRRWLNGSFFAAIYAQAHLFSIWRSAHSLGRKLMLHLEFLYQCVSMLFSWFSIGNFFLVFRILTGALSDSALGFAPGRILSVVLLWIYCGCIVTTFVLAFGNRPMGTQVFYILIVAFFAFLMAYLMFAAIYISVKSVQYAICMNDGFSASLIFSNETFRDLVVSMMSTYALYFVSSFLFFEPFHMFTSFLQYLLISPAYINVLNVYAFCNIHDISWGTKGDTEQKLDLGVAKTNQAGKLEVDIPTHVDDIDSSYIKEISTLAEPLKKEAPKPSKDDETQDYYALFRSSVVLVWMFTNFALIAVVLNTAGLSVFADTSDSSSSSNSNSGSSTDSGTFSKRDAVWNVAAELLARADDDKCGSLGSSGGIRTQIYLSVVLWAVAALAAFRFIGAVWYLVARLFGR
ncbi:chitin synthase 1 [Trichomonascus vanleenenianus]|uniref:chitin synthase 1 n=1 Tax=Trichomonascus vanleenenianus TaxID=2268995 RepID=UPI003ECAF234